MSSGTKKTRKKKEAKREAAKEAPPQVVTRTLADNTYVGIIREGPLGEQYLDCADAKYMWANGIAYEGPFVQSRIEGKGRYLWPDGSSYEGQLLQGKKHGQGVYVSADGQTKYDGQWCLGKRSGLGRLSYNPEGSSFYDGCWKDGKKHGQGRQVWPSGNMYEGAWVEGKMSGPGTMLWRTPAGTETYTGAWENNEPHGEGVHTWHTNDAGQLSGMGGGAGQVSVNPPIQQLNNRYEGQFSHGRREGLGTFYYANGACYRGEWKDHMKHGRGRHTFEDGTVYEGPFDEDQMVEYRKPLPAEGAELMSRSMDIADLDPLALPSDKRGLELFAGAGYTDHGKIFREVYNMLLRHLGELRDLYARYRATMPRQGADPYILQSYQLWCFARDAGLVTPGCSLARCNRAVFSGRRHHGEVAPEDAAEVRPLGRGELADRRPSLVKQDTRGSLARSSACALVNTGNPSARSRALSRSSTFGPGVPGASKGSTLAPSILIRTSPAPLSVCGRSTDGVEEEDEEEEEDDEEEQAETEFAGSPLSGSPEGSVYGGSPSENSGLASPAAALRAAVAEADDSPANAPTIAPSRRSFAARMSFYDDAGSVAGSPRAVRVGPKFRRRDGSSLSNIHSPTKQLLFRQFLEAIVRLSVARFKNERGLEGQIQRTFKECILPACDSQPAGSEAVFSFLVEKDYLQVMEEFSGELLGIFQQPGPLAECGGYGKVRRNFHVSARLDEVLRVKDVLRLLDSCGLLRRQPPSAAELTASAVEELAAADDGDASADEAASAGSVAEKEVANFFDDARLDAHGGGSSSRDLARGTDFGFIKQSDIGGHLEGCEEFGGAGLPKSSRKREKASKEDRPGPGTVPLAVAAAPPPVSPEASAADLSQCDFSVTPLQVMRVLGETLGPACLRGVCPEVGGLGADAAAAPAVPAPAPGRTSASSSALAFEAPKAADQDRPQPPGEGEFPMLEYVESEVIFVEFVRLLIQMAELGMRKHTSLTDRVSAPLRFRAFLQHTLLPALKARYEVPEPPPSRGEAAAPARGDRGVAAADLAAEGAAGEEAQGAAEAPSAAGGEGEAAAEPAAEAAAAPPELWLGFEGPLEPPRKASTVALAEGSSARGRRWWPKGYEDEVSAW